MPDAAINNAVSAPGTSVSNLPLTFLVCQLAGGNIAFRLENVERLVPMAQLSRPPGLPSLLEGFLNLDGSAVPVIRLDRLLNLPPITLDLYTMLIILKGVSEVPAGVLVDRASRVLAVKQTTLLSAEQSDSFNGFAEAFLTEGDQTIHVLSPGRILIEKEKALLAAFQRMEQSRLTGWESGAA